MEYEMACQNIADHFLDIYYDDAECWWIGSEVGGVLGVNDEFWSMEDLVNALRYKPSREKLMDFYYHRMDKEPKYSMKNYLKLK